MQTNIKSTNLELTEPLRKYVQSKVNMLEKYLGKMQAINCDVEIGMISHHHNKGEIYKAEINLEIPGELLRVEKTEKDLYKAIDKVKDHLKDMIVKRKEKLIDKKRRTAK